MPGYDSGGKLEGHVTEVQICRTELNRDASSKDLRDRCDRAVKDFDNDRDRMRQERAELEARARDLRDDVEKIVKDYDHGRRTSNTGGPKGVRDPSNVGLDTTDQGMPNNNDL